MDHRYDTQMLIRAVNRKRRLLVIAYCGLMVLTAVCACLADLPGLLLTLVCLALSLAYLILYGMVANTVNNLFYRDCDPAAFLTVYEATFGKRAKAIHRLRNQMVSHYYAGDFSQAEGYTQNLLAMTLTPFDRCTANEVLGLIAAQRGQREELCQRIALVEPAVKKVTGKHQTLAYCSLVTLQFELAMMDGDKEKARQYHSILLKLTEDLPYKRPINYANGAYASGRLALLEQDLATAKEQFEKTVKLGGVTFMATEAKAYLETLNQP